MKKDCHTDRTGILSQIGLPHRQDWPIITAIEIGLAYFERHTPIGRTLSQSGPFEKYFYR